MKMRFPFLFYSVLVLCFKEQAADSALVELLANCCTEGQQFGQMLAKSVADCANPVYVEEIKVDPQHKEKCRAEQVSCCEQHFTLNDKCQEGIKYAQTKDCDKPTTEIGKMCCEECSLGRWTGEGLGKEGCGKKGELYGSPTSEHRKAAYYNCCIEAAEEAAEKEAAEEAAETAITPTKCNASSCDHICEDKAGRIKCSCRKGYRLQPDFKSCLDINECAEAEDDLCTTPGMVCHNLPGSYACVHTRKSDNVPPSCPPGFKRNVQEQVCDDINECKLPRPPCSEFYCENTIGGYKCSGKPGKPYKESELEAAEKNTEPVTKSENICPPGFRSGPGGDCLDIDECEEHLDDCQRLSQNCINTHGTFFCQDHVSKRCPPGFRANKAGVCEDIDECEESSEVCQKTEMCINMPGAYTCKSKISTLPKLRPTTDCQEGTRLRPGSSMCEDIDECREGTHLCDHFQNCVNTYGGHECQCKIGFELNSSGSCVDVDECALKVDNCGEGTYCLNTVSTYTCVKVKTPATSSTTLPPYEYEYYDTDEEDNSATSNQTSGMSVPKPILPSDQRDSSQPTPATSRSISTSTTTTSTTRRPFTNRPRQPPRPIPTNPPPKIPWQIPLNSPPQTQLLRPETRRTEDDQTKSITLEKERDPKGEYTIDTSNIPKGQWIYVGETHKGKKSTPDNWNEKTNLTPTVTHPTFSTPSSTVTPTQNRPTRPENSIPRSTEQYGFDNRPPRPEENRPTEPELRATETPAPNKPTRPEDSILQPREEYGFDDRPPRRDYNRPSERGYNRPPGRDYNGPPERDYNRPPGRDYDRSDDEKLTFDAFDPRAYCLYGYEKNAQGYCVDINECERNHLCSIAEVCVNKPGGYVCECKEGFILNTMGWCETADVTTPVPTRPSTFATMSCGPGYTFDNIQRLCVDIDECVNRAFEVICFDKEDCVNTAGSYHCICGKKCQKGKSTFVDVPRRLTKESHVFTIGAEYGKHGTKVVMPVEGYYNIGDTVTHCPWGYKYTPDDVCLDIDECALNVSECGKEQTCVNFHGGYSCLCPEGYQMVGKGCKDVNECDYGVKICPSVSTCVNEEGSYRCKCDLGFRNAPDNDKVCMDVDECAERPRRCEHDCTNTWGGYRCRCPTGYQLSANNRTCEDVNECEVWTAAHPRGRLCGGECVNTPGSYRCSCPKGYLLSKDGRACIDIDECENGEATCARAKRPRPGEVCQNTRGGYHCHKVNCPPGYRLENNHRCSRIERRCPINDWQCLHQPTSYSYHFITFVSHVFLTPEGSVDLFTMHGPSWYDSVANFEIRMVDVQAPRAVKPLDLTCFRLRSTRNTCVVTLLCSPGGPQSAELELTMSLHRRGQYAGSAAARLVVTVSAYEF